MKNYLLLVALFSPFLFTGFYLTKSVSAVNTPPCPPTTWTVQNSLDAAPVPPVGSLREAVENGCPGDTIVFDITTNFNDIVLDDDITIDHDLVMIGNGYQETRVDGNSQHRGFHIVDNANVEFWNMTIRNCIALDGESGGAIWIEGTPAPNGDGQDPDISPSVVKLFNMVLSDVTSSFAGGGIYNFNSDLYLQDVTINRGFAQFDGGGIYSGGNLFIDDVSIQNSYAIDAKGGGIYMTDQRFGQIPEAEGDDPVQLEIADITMNNNSALSGGGGIYVRRGQLSLNGGRFNQNVTQLYHGGAIYLESQPPVGDVPDGNGEPPMWVVHLINNGYFTQNKTFGGSSLLSGWGGAIYSEEYIGLEIDSSAFFNNTAPDGGGAIASGDPLLYGQFQKGPEASPNGYLSVESSLFMGNHGDNGPGGAIFHTVPAEVNASYLVSNYANGYGGAVCAYLTQLYADTSYFGNNSVYLDCPTPNCFSAGGAVAVITSQSDIIPPVCAAIARTDENGEAIHASFFSNSMYKDNYSSRFGGGVYVGQSLQMSMYYAPENDVDSQLYDLFLADITIENNDAGFGGGLLNGGAGVRADRCLVEDNYADEAGGGIYNAKGVEDDILVNDDVDVMHALLDLNDVTVENNSANCEGGNPEGEGDPHLPSFPGGDGGGIFSEVGTYLRVDSSMIDNNCADDDGGGVAIGDWSLLEFQGDNIPDYDEIDFDALITHTVIGYNYGDDNGGGVANWFGALWIEDVTIYENEASNDGGGLYNEGGAVNLRRSDIDHNESSDSDGEGGGIFNRSFGGNDHPLTIENDGVMNVDSCNLFENDARDNGGGLVNDGGHMFIQQTNVYENDIEDEYGGGIRNLNSGRMTIQKSAIYNNEILDGLYGGGISNEYDADLFIYQSTISGNGNDYETSDGGGIYHCGDTLVMDHVTVVDNETNRDGGGLYVCDGRTLIIGNSIIANNYADDDGDDFYDGGGAIGSLGYNLVEDEDENDFPLATGDTTEVDPMLGPLADNGGFTRTHALLCGSIAYNAANPASGGLDQRCEDVWAGRRDMGAFEAQFDASDPDGDGYCGPGPDNPDEEDCDETNPDINPGVSEYDFCGDGLDNDCDGEIDEGPPIGDGDHFISRMTAPYSGYDNISGPDWGYGDFTYPDGDPGGPCITGFGPYFFITIYPGSLGPPPLYGLYKFGGWVDWNQDGTFSPGEQIFAQYCSYLQISRFFMMPPGTPDGQYTMRLIVRGNAGAPGCQDDIFDPNFCGGAGNGETEDYTLCVGPPPVPGMRVSDEMFETLLNGTEGGPLQVDVYPNPFEDELYVSYDHLAGDNATIELLDSHGKMIRRDRFAVSNTQGLYRISSGRLMPGMYVLRLITDAGAVTKMVVKQ